MIESFTETEESPGLAPFDPIFLITAFEDESDVVHDSKLLIAMRLNTLEKTTSNTTFMDIPFIGSRQR